MKPITKLFSVVDKRGNIFCRPPPLSSKVWKVRHIRVCALQTEAFNEGLSKPKESKFTTGRFNLIPQVVSELLLYLIQRYPLITDNVYCGPRGNPDKMRRISLTYSLYTNRTNVSVLSGDFCTFKKIRSFIRPLVQSYLLNPDIMVFRTRHAEPA